MTVNDGVESLLIVENAKTVKHILKKVLEMTGYKVFTADNGEEALEIFMAHGEISLVLFDVIMPGRNGKKILDRIRALKPEVKTLLISGYPDDMLHEQGIDLEEVKFMAKPFYLSELLGNIRTLLDED